MAHRGGAKLSGEDVARVLGVAIESARTLAVSNQTSKIKAFATIQLRQLLAAGQIIVKRRPIVIESLPHLPEGFLSRLPDQFSGCITKPRE